MEHDAIVATLLHEMVHASAGDGHKERFCKEMDRLASLGALQSTQTTPGSTERTRGSSWISAISGRVPTTHSQTSHPVLAFKVFAGSWRGTMESGQPLRL